MLINNLHMKAFLNMLPTEDMQAIFQLMSSELQQREDGMKKIDNDSPDRRHARAVPRFEREDKTDKYNERVNMADVRANAGQTPEWQDAGVNTQTPTKDKLHVSESGATSSHVPLRYDIIPRSLIERAAERYTMGANKHGERNYQLGLADRGHIVTRINHIYEHLNKLLHPDYRKADSPQDEEGIEVKSINDNLGAILWGVGFLCEVADHKEGIIIFHNLRSEGRLKVTTD